MVIKKDVRHKPADGDLLITMACPVSCDFCVYSCLPSLEPQKWMPEETIRRVAKEYSKNDIAIRICGGEPFYNLDKLKKCIDVLLEYYNPFDLNIISSGFFARNIENTRKNLNVIKNTGFDTLIVSIDRFHLPRVPLTKITNIIEVCKEMDIETILRISLDTASFPLADKISEIIAKYKTPIEVHSWGIVGRAEKLDTSPLKNSNQVEDYIFKKISYYARKYKTPTDPRYYLTNSTKTKFDETFFPTTFPNGNVYATSFTFKSELMGNINKENLSDMIQKFRNTYSENFLFSRSNYWEINNFVPAKFEDQFDVSRNIPFNEDFPEEAIGRKFIKIKTDDDLDSILNKLKEKRKFHGSYGMNDREFLLSFELKEKDLWNQNTKIKIQDFLEKLKSEKIKFVLSRPLPPCLKIETNDKQPKNCFECREMFTVEEGVIKFCEPLENRFGPELNQVNNREQIFDYFNSVHGNMKINETCKKCVYKIRGVCNSMCLVK